MTDNATARLGARQQSQGSNTNTWGDDKLNEVMRLIDRSMHGVESLAMTGDTTLSWVNYLATNTGQVAFLTLTGSLSSAAALIVPSVQWAWKGISNTTGQPITVRTSAGVGAVIPNGRQIAIRCDGSDCYFAGGNYIGADITETNAHDLVDYSALGAYVTAAINAASTNINGAFSTTYVFTATGGETSKSGTDDHGLTLAYTVNYEKVYLNGVLQERAKDYVATTGTSITGLNPALQPDDTLTIVAEAAYSVANTYTSAQIDALIAAFLAAAHTWPLAQTFTAGITTAALNVTAASLKLQSAGVSGTLAWAPSSTNKTITLPNGTTDFTATGGTSQVVKQVSAGAALTVGQLAASDLSNGTTGSAGGVVLATGPTLTTLTVSSGGAAITGTSAVTGQLSASGGFYTTGAPTYAASMAGLAFAGGSAYLIGTGASTVTYPTAINIYVAHSDASGGTVLAAFSLASAKTNFTITPPTSSSGLATGTLWSNSGIATFA